MTIIRVSAICAMMALCWLLIPSPGFTAGERNLVRGKQLYEKYCLACHGPQGRGDGMTTLDPPVADLTSSDVLLKPDSRLLRSIHEGRPNTAMDAWQSAMSEEAIRDVLAYVLTFPR
ncbi:MAG TPA: cytochrome c [Nitrospira sp.]|nr:cytochrome c [Nitrospira sp.]